MISNGSNPAGVEDYTEVWCGCVHVLDMSTAHFLTCVQKAPLQIGLDFMYIQPASSC